MADRTKSYSLRFPKRLRFLRKQAGLTQEELGKKVKKSESTVRMWELEQSEPDFQTIIDLSSIFNVNADFIIGKQIKPIIPVEQWHQSLREDYENASNEAEKDYIVYKYCAHTFFDDKKDYGFNDGLKLAIFGSTDPTDEMLDKVLEYAQFLKNQNEGKR